jgi:hypothetical protein
MSFEEFKSSLAKDQPAENLSPALKAMWWDGKGDWERSHNIAQDISSQTGSWIHAYLHRKEGDPGNASYWYQRARLKLPSISLDDEWNEIVQSLLR